MRVSPLAHIDLERELKYLLAKGLSSNTDLCRIMSSCGSDKAQPFHNYTVLYDWLFCRFREEPLALFELGLGTNKPGAPSSMGENGKPGASLRGWREYFSKAEIVGADIDRDVLFQEERIRTFWTDQRDPRAIRELWASAGDCFFDIIIDDGLHEAPANACFFLESFGRLKSGGIYIVEDIEGEANVDLINCLARIASCSSRYATFQRLDHPINNGDNAVLICQKS
jgi:hypothetical protein